MTRCYEFYCAYEHNPKFCSDKGDRIVDYIEEYIAFMRGKGVQFDKTPTDKALFVRQQEHYGSERVVTRGDLKEEELNLPIEPHHGAQPLSEIQIPTVEISSVQTPNPKVNVESCPDGICTTTKEEFKEKAGLVYPFDGCICVQCPNHKACYGE